MASPGKENKAVLVSCGNVAWLGLGGNVSGTFGNPVDSFRRAVTGMQSYGLQIVAVSPVVTSPALGSVRQPWYRNTVVAVAGS
ncbi:MAG TPA: hypothetical protein VFV47_06040, partial [Hyphomicrobiaceae bacterium]|nr:hypothetical protein [Hyphomicrobiaceae bacterium]